MNFDECKPLCKIHLTLLSTFTIVMAHSYSVIYYCIAVAFVIGLFIFVLMIKQPSFAVCP